MSADTAPAYIYTESPRYDADAAMRGGERFPDGASLKKTGSAKNQPVVSGFYATADPEISFDGQRLLFTGKQKKTDSWQIYEAALAGGAPRRVTLGSEDCIRPFYLPENRIVYARKSAGEFRLEALPLAGGEVLRLTYAPGNYVASQILRDGRILFEGPHPMGSGAGRELYTVYSDGSGMESVRCDHGKARSGGSQLGSGAYLFATSGGLGQFTAAKTKQADVKAPEGTIDGPVVEIAPDKWVISFKPKGAQVYGLYEWSPTGGAAPAAVVQGKVNATQPVKMAAREAPKRHPSALHTWDGANLLCLNAYESPLKIAAGSVANVRMYTRDAAGKSMLLGQAPVESDGSFYLHVPSEQPLRIELVDKSGAAIASEHGWFWMRRGEQRMCVGCHAGPERSPENAVPKILLRSTKPASMIPVSGGSR